MEGTKSKIVLLLIIVCLLFSSMSLPASDEYESNSDYSGHFVTHTNGDGLGDTLTYNSSGSTDDIIFFGSEYIFNSGGTRDISVSSLDSTHFVVAYDDNGHSDYGTAVIGIVSGDTISYGSEYVFNSDKTFDVSVSSLDSTHFVVAYRDNGNLNYGTAVIGIVSGDTISYGSEYVFYSAHTHHISVSSLDSTHFVASYGDSSSYGTSIIGTISGSTISYGSKYVFNSDTTGSISVSSLDTTHFVASYRDSSDYGTAVIGIVSGDTISYGSEYVFYSGITYHISVSSLDSTHFVVGYKDVDNSNYGTAVVGTISGTTISYGSEYVFNYGSTQHGSVSSLNATHFVVAYDDNGHSDYGTAIIGIVSGTDISYSSEYVFNSATTYYVSVSSLDSTHFVVGYVDWGNSGYGTSIIGSCFITQENVYVDDNADPSWYDATHVKTIQEGIDNASAGGTVYIWDGTYNENVVINKSIDIIGNGSATCISYATTVIQVTADWVNITSLNITDGKVEHCGSGNHTTYSSCSFENNYRCIEINAYSIIYVHNVSFLNCNITMVGNINTYALVVRYVNDITVANCKIITTNVVALTHEGGIYVFNGKRHNISHNTITGTDGRSAVGIRFESSVYDSIIHNNTISDYNGEDGCILLSTSSNNIIDNNTINNSYISMYVLSGSNYIRNNTITNSSMYGIYFTGNSNWFYNNYVADSGTSNANDAGSNHWNIVKQLGSNIIGGDYLGGNYWDDYSGVDTNGDGIGDTMLPYDSLGNIASGGDSLPLVYFSNIYVDDDADPSWYDPTHVETIAEANTKVSAGDSIYIYNGTYTTAEIDMYKEGVNVIGESKDVNITGTGQYIFDVHSHYVTFRNLSMFSSDVACIRGDEVVCLTIKNCNITKKSGDFTQYGIYLYKSAECTVQDCDIFDIRDFGIIVVGPDSMYHIIDRNNIINCYATYSAGIQIQVDNSSYIINNYISKTYYGIEIRTVENGSIYNNNIIEDNDYGIFIGENNKNNSIIFNTISEGVTGIQWCVCGNSENNISYNTIRENECGIYVSDCGMLDGGNDNVIYGNIFLKNVNHSIIDRSGGCSPTDIVWNISYYQVGGVDYGGGNYWDNYTGVDEFHGPNQDIPGGDNVGDTSYHIPQIGGGMDEMGEYVAQGSYEDQYPIFSLGEDTIPLPATNVETTTATLNGWYGWQGTTPATCGFYCGINGACTQANHDHNFTASGTYTNETFSKGVTGLDAGHCHCFNVWAKNVTGFYHPTITTEYFLTKPSGPPENFSVVNVGATNITLSWNNVTDWVGNDINQTTIIRYSNTSQPATPTSGTLGYWGTAETCTIENLDLDVQYYFSAWTHIRAICNGTYVRYQNSSEFATITAYTQGGDYNIFIRYENRTYGLVNLSEEFPVYTCDKSDIIIYDEPFSTGVLTDVKVNGTGNLVLNTTVDGNFTSPGNRVSLEYSLSGIAEDSGVIAWSELKPANTDIDVFYNLSTNGGISWNGWIQASNGGSITGINIGTNMDGYLIKFRENLTTTNNLTTPELINLYIRVERTCMWVNHSGPHRAIIHYYGHDFDEYYGMVTYIIFENGTAIHDPMPHFNCSNMTNGTFNFSVNRTIKYIEFCWNDSTDCNYRCNRVISPVKGQRNITFFIRTDLPVYGEGVSYMNGSIVKYLYSFVDETGKFRRPNEPRATIYTYNDDEEKMIIHSEYFDDTEAIHPWLVYEKKYFIGVDCIYLTYERIGIAPASENQNPEVRIPYNYQFDYSFYDLINLDVGWFDSGFYVHYHDTTFSTISTTFKVYGYYNHTLLYSDSTTHSGKNFTYTCNTSGNYIWVINTTLDDLDNLYDGTYSSGETPMFSGMKPITDINTIDDILTIILGRTPLYDADNPNVEVPWTYIMIFALAFIVMTSLGKLNAFMGTLGVGFVLTFSGAAITGLQTLFSNYAWWHGPVLILIGVFIIAFAIVGLMGGVED